MKPAKLESTSLRLRVNVRQTKVCPTPRYNRNRYERLTLILSNLERVEHQSRRHHPPLLQLATRSRTETRRQSRHSGGPRSRNLLTRIARKTFPQFFDPGGRVRRDQKVKRVPMDHRSN